MAETLLARHVRRRLAAKGTSITELAEEIGMERPALYRIFKSRRPHNNTLRKLAHAIDEDPELLFDLVEEENKK